MTELFEHNRIAYESAVSMLEKTGRAAVIHPTGTGKSFIGFRFCADNPDKAVCWLSPSEYIFRTQLENLKAEGGEEPRNVRFLTYARLMNMGTEEMARIKPDAVVLDEFHRAGAKYWGSAVRRFLEMYPGVPVLGLSATAVRYLDSRRDMAEELFDGNVASEMTLGEAIVRGILNPPKYITTVYSYAKDLERLKECTERLRNKSRREKAKRQLEELRRALEMADGLETVFDRHMTDRTGKYIVFCADKEHMDRMMKEAGDWFSRVDSNPHIYSVYFGDPSASRAFSDFRADRDDTHLRLLYCIDALNEGIHVGDISGVILLRPTVSPIIYKQQIGRALSAGGRSKEPVIFDIVNNIAGLYSIDSVREEMREAVRYCRFLGEEARVMNDRFLVVGAAEDCRRLFDELERTLYASWEFMYGEAEAYYAENGNLLPPQDYITENGSRLGQWVAAQRAVYRGGTGMPRERIERLNAIGMNWQTLHERQWEEGFLLAEAHCAAHESLKDTAGMEPALARWLFRQRQRRKEGLMTGEQFEKLSALGMEWDPEDRWERKLELARKYYERNGSLDVPAAYKTEDGICLGAWVSKQREKYAMGKLTEEQAGQLEALGISWEEPEETWRKGYEHAKSYHERKGDLNVSGKYAAEDGFRLGAWLANQRTRFREGRMPAGQRELLEEIGMRWSVQGDRWQMGYEHAAAYREEFGDINVPQGYVCGDGYSLGSWIVAQRKARRAGKLAEERTELLEELGMVWDVNEDKWERGYRHAKSYRTGGGRLPVPQTYVSGDGYPLGEWMRSQERKYRRGMLESGKVKSLAGIGVVF